MKTMLDLLQQLQDSGFQMLMLTYAARGIGGPVHAPGQE